MNHELEAVVREALDEVAADLVELRFGGSRSRPVLQVRMERRDGRDVTVEDCAAASRVVGARLDADSRLADRYELEVSSPGVERPLRTVADWRRFAGRRATVLSAVLHGRAEVEILGVDGAPGLEVLRVRDARGTERQIALADVRDARLAFHW